MTRGGGSGPFGADARRQMQTVVDLASAALLRVRVQAAAPRALAEARDRRQELERVMQSRSRLMRRWPSVRLPIERLRARHIQTPAEAPKRCGA